MSGNVKFLLDSCFLIRWYGQHEDALQIIKQRHLSFEQCAFSVVSFAEVLGWHGASSQDIVNLRSLFSRLAQKIAMTDEIVEYTISIRRQHKIKLPDALILATAQAHQLELITLDEKLQRIFLSLN